MTFEAALAAVQRAANDVDALGDLARSALQAGEEESALCWLLPAAEQSDIPLLWQWVGLLYRALDEHGSALNAFEQASRLAPNEVGIAHGHARVALEAGLDAVDLFLHAHKLAPSDGAILLGLAAARNAVGRGQLAANELAAALDRAPAWIDGYEPLAQLLSTLGQRDQATEQLERALARFPCEEPLWLALLGLHLRREDFAALRNDLGRAAAAGVPAASLAFYRAVVAGELDPETFPAALFRDPPSDAMPHLAVWQIRHLLRVGAVDQAVNAVDRAIAAGVAAAWPYAATAWRLSGDDRREWLEGGDPGLVRVFDLMDRLPPLAECADGLRRLHVATGEYLDQSVRGGTQTDGPLLSRIDPFVRGLRGAIVSAVEDYVAALPAVDAAHPLLRQRRDRRIRFSGSWSVRLPPGGRHSNHVHLQGWISSALYISLPETTSQEPEDAGWFTVGEPPDNLGLDLPPSKKVEPRTGQLVLFPSWMWHGTKPFGQGERLTVAFDVRQPI